MHENVFEFHLSVSLKTAGDSEAQKTLSLRNLKYAEFAMALALVAGWLLVLTAEPEKMRWISCLVSNLTQTTRLTDAGKAQTNRWPRKRSFSSQK